VFNAIDHHLFAAPQRCEKSGEWLLWAVHVRDDCFRKRNAALDLMAAESPFYILLVMALMAGSMPFQPDSFSFNDRVRSDIRKNISEPWMRSVDAFCAPIETESAAGQVRNSLHATGQCRGAALVVLREVTIAASIAGLAKGPSS